LIERAFDGRAGAVTKDRRYATQAPPATCESNPINTPARGRATSSTSSGVSERFACRVTGQRRTTQRHRAAATKPAHRDAALRQWLRGYANKHLRWGHRRAYHDARHVAQSDRAQYSKEAILSRFSSGPTVDVGPKE
jgi:hypothetical protein